MRHFFPRLHTQFCVLLSPHSVGFSRPRLVAWLPVFFLTLFAVSARGQDRIVKKDKTNIEASILEIGSDEVKYKRFDFQDGPTYTIKKSEVFLIIYKGGRTESFEAAPETTTAAPRQASAKQNTTAKQVAELLTAPAPRAEAAPKTETATPPSDGISKRRWRLFTGVGAHGEEISFAPKLACEVLGLNKKIGFVSGLSNAGVGFAINSFLDNQQRRSSVGSTIFSYKQYLSSYVFKEFETRFISAGVLAGPALNYTHGEIHPSGSNAEPVTASFITGGLHTGQYLHKYISTNKKGEKTAFIRAGADQFFMIKGSYGGSISLTFGY